MGLKTFSVEDAVYWKFSRMCKESGISMSRQIEMFMRTFVEEEPKAREEYARRLNRIRKGKFIAVADFGKRYGV